MEIPTWDQYLQRPQISQLNIQAPYDSSFTVDGMFENGSINAAAIQTGTLTAVATIGGANAGTFIKIDGTMNRILGFDGSTNRFVIGNPAH